MNRGEIARGIGVRIRAAREAARLTQAELATKLGVEHSTVNQYEMGRRSTSLEVLERLSEALNRPIAYFWPKAAVPGAAVFGFHLERLTPENRQIVERIAESLARDQGDASQGNDAQGGS